MSFAQTAAVSSGKVLGKLEMQASRKPTVTLHDVQLRELRGTGNKAELAAEAISDVARLETAPVQTRSAHQKANSYLTLQSPDTASAFQLGRNPGKISLGSLAAVAPKAA